MRKKFQPKNIEDLASMYYDQSRSKDRVIYESGVQNKIAGWQESKIKKSLSNMGIYDVTQRAEHVTFVP